MNKLALAAAYIHTASSLCHCAHFFFIFWLKCTCPQTKILHSRRREMLVNVASGWFYLQAARKVSIMIWFESQKRRTEEDWCVFQDLTRSKKGSFLFQLSQTYVLYDAFRTCFKKKKYRTLRGCPNSSDIPFGGRRSGLTDNHQLLG